MGRRGWVHRHDLTLFFVLAFLLSWPAWPLVILNPGSSPLLPFGPLIAAAVVAAMSGGLRELFGRLGRWRAAPRWYLAAVLVPVGVTALIWWTLAALWVVTAVVVAVRGRWSGAAVRDVRGDDSAAARRADDVQGSA